MNDRLWVVQTSGDDVEKNASCMFVYMYTNVQSLEDRVLDLEIEQMFGERKTDEVILELLSTLPKCYRLLRRLLWWWLLTSDDNEGCLLHDSNIKTGD